MKTITFHYDFLSPYAYLAFEHLPQALEGLSFHVRYRPVLLGALLRAHGLLGPAEVPHKREWTYRHVLWQAHAHGIAMDMPAVHPFNPLPHLRLALASTDGSDTNRHVTETIFREVWRGGGDASDPARLSALAARLPRVREPDSDAVKAQLRANTEAAAGAGIFGTPTMEVDGQHFWGFDSLPALRAWMAGDPWFEQGAWASAGQRPAGAPPGKSQ
jgi:2-hydroxychromene-2-carboxylate isomerase